MTETLTVRRGSTDKLSKRTTDSSHTIQGLFAWSGYADANIERAESSVTRPQLYVQRGTDLKARDRIERANGDTFRVVGGAMWDHDHPTSGHDFGWCVYQLESNNG